MARNDPFEELLILVDPAINQIGYGEQIEIWESLGGRKPKKVFEGVIEDVMIDPRMYMLLVKSKNGDEIHIPYAYLLNPVNNIEIRVV